MLIILKNFHFLMHLLKNQKLNVKLKIKRLKNVDLSAELLFYDQLNIIKTDQAFKGYANHTKLK